MTNLYEVSARGPEYPVGFHQSDSEFSGWYIAMGNTPEESKRALEAYLGNGWHANESVKEMKELNKLPLEQRLGVLVELGRSVIGKDGKMVEQMKKKYTVADMEKALGPLADRLFAVFQGCSREKTAEWFYGHKIPCFDGSYTPAEIFEKDKASLGFMLDVLKMGVVS